MTRAGSVGVLLLLAVATWGAGGAAPYAQLVWHVVLVGLLVVALCRPGDHRIDGAVCAALALVTAVILVGWIFSANSYSGLLTLIAWCAWCATLWLAAREGPGLAVRLRDPLLVLAAIHALLALAQAWLLDVPRPAATFLNTNHLGAWLVAVLLLAWNGETPGKWRGGLMALVLIALLTTQSRGALLGLVAGAIVAVLVAKKRWSPAFRRATIAIVALGLVAIAGWIGFRRVTDDDPFPFQRVHIWRASLASVAEHPWTGAGPGQFGTAALRYQFDDARPPLRHDRVFRITHSDLLRPGTELGWPGWAAFALLAGAFVRAARRHRSNPLPVGPLAALAALTVHGAVDNLSQRPAVYLLGALCCGVVAGVPREPVAAVLSRSRVLAAAALIAVFAVVDHAPHRAWSLLQRPLDDEGLRRAMRLNRLDVAPWMRLSAALRERNGEWTAGDYAVARDAAEHAIRLDRAAAAPYRELGRIEVRACEQLFRDVATRERAVAAFEAAARRAPYDPMIPLELAGFLLDNGDADGAAAAAARTLEIEPEAVLPRLLLAEAWLAAHPGSGRERARLLMAEAEERADRWSEAIENDYERTLLAPSAAEFERVRAALAHARGDGAGAS